MDSPAAKRRKQQHTGSTPLSRGGDRDAEPSHPDTPAVLLRKSPAGMTNNQDGSGDCNQHRKVDDDGNFDEVHKVDHKYSKADGNYDKYQRSNSGDDDEEEEDREYGEEDRGCEEEEDRKCEEEERERAEEEERECEEDVEVAQLFQSKQEQQCASVSLCAQFSNASFSAQRHRVPHHLPSLQLPHLHNQSSQQVMPFSLHQSPQQIPPAHNPFISVQPIPVQSYPPHQFHFQQQQQQQQYHHLQQQHLMQRIGHLETLIMRQTVMLEKALQSVQHRRQDNAQDTSLLQTRFHMIEPSSHCAADFDRNVEIVKIEPRGESVRKRACSAINHHFKESIFAEEMCETEPMLLLVLLHLLKSSKRRGATEIAFKRYDQHSSKLTLTVARVENNQIHILHSPLDSPQWDNSFSIGKTLFESTMIVPIALNNPQLAMQQYNAVCDERNRRIASALVACTDGNRVFL